MELDTVAQGDCVEIMKGMESESVDLVVTDPPYGIDYQSARRIDSERFPKIANDTRPMTTWIDSAYRVLKDSGRVLCFCRWDTQAIFKNAINEAGFNIKSHVIWNRQNHGLGDLKRQFAPQHDIIWYATKGDYIFPWTRPCSVITIPRVPATALIHPNQKPTNLLIHLLLRLSIPMEVVCDPFMGSGTTAIACIRSNRHYIGIELEQKYVDIANERIRQEQAQLKFAF